ncbi:MAG: hemerythrin domain-containing protein [Deltaproteobacteria bacterium]
MQARGPLMIEHRLIEKMIGQIHRLLERIETDRRIDPILIDTAVDFIRVYADRTHHGKEEDILFRLLAEKKLSADDRKMMDDLIADHEYGRKLTAAMVDANERYRNGEVGVLPEINANLRALVDFYPKHIDKEDKIFFPASRRYFTAEEDQAMLQQFREFDREMIHYKYRTVVEKLEQL